MVDLTPIHVVTVLGMAIVTYATKVSGLWILEYVELSDRARDGLDALPGGIVVAILVPRLARGGLPEWVAAVLVLVAARRTDSVLIALCVGIATVLILRGTPFRNLPP